VPQTALQNDERNRLVTIIANLYQFRDSDTQGRRRLLGEAGVSDVLSALRLEGPEKDVAWEVVERLARKGPLDDGSNIHALGALLRQVLTLGDLPQEDARFIARLVVQYTLVDDPQYLNDLRKHHNISYLFSPGVIDFVISFESAALESNPETEIPAKEWYLPLANIKPYTVRLLWPAFPPEAAIDFVPSGKQDLSYGARVSSFNWQAFYERLGGGAFLEAAKKQMRKDYDYILIDSRTGLSDTAGICTVQMPADVLVLCFTYNTQSLEGAAAVARSVDEQRRRAGLGIRIFPVPMRVELGETIKLERAREAAQSKFTAFLEHIGDEKMRRRYWGKVEIPYVPYYAYEETLATFRDKPGVALSLLAPLEQLSSYLTEGTVHELTPPPEEDHEAGLRCFTRQPRQRSVEDLFHYYPEMKPLYDRVMQKYQEWRDEKGNARSLLDAAQVRRLRDTTDLLVALLEEPSFRRFWDQSYRRTLGAEDEKRRQRLKRCSLLLNILASLAPGAVLMALILFPMLSKGEPSALLDRSWSFLVSFVGGIIGVSLNYLNQWHVQRDDNRIRFSGMSLVQVLLMGIMTLTIVDLLHSLHPVQTVWDVSITAIVFGYTLTQFLSNVNLLPSYRDNN
jgi:hypothetical protein